MQFENGLVWYFLCYYLGKVVYHLDMDRFGQLGQFGEISSSLILCFDK